MCISWVSGWEGNSFLNYNSMAQRDLQERCAENRCVRIVPRPTERMSVATLGGGSANNSRGGQTK